MRSINSGFDICVVFANSDQGRELDQMVVKRVLRVSVLGTKAERRRRRPVGVSGGGTLPSSREAGSGVVIDGEVLGGGTTSTG